MSDRHGANVILGRQLKQALTLVRLERWRHVAKNHIVKGGTSCQSGPESFEPAPFAGYLLFR